MTPVVRTLCLSLSCIAAMCARADAVACEGFDIEYTTFVSTVIPASVAKAHGIVQSDDRIITNIVVKNKGKATRAAVAGTATNLLNQATDLNFKPVPDDGGLYYLAVVKADGRSTIRYGISVRPAGSTATCRIDFIRDYYEAGTR